MKVFCPNCGSDNEGMPGGRVTCKACTASFEVPRPDAPDSGPATPTGPSAPFPTSLPPNPAPKPPTHQPWPGLGGEPATPPSSRPGAGWVGGPTPSQPISTFQPPSSIAYGPPQTNPLAIVSLVLGILCCFPFAVGAIITGVIARNQIASSGGQQKGSELAMVGIVLGGLSIAFNVLGMIASVIGK